MSSDAGSTGTSASPEQPWIASLGFCPLSTAGGGTPRRAARPRGPARRGGRRERSRPPPSKPGSVQRSLPMVGTRPCPVPCGCTRPHPYPSAHPCPGTRRPEQERDPEAQIADLGRRRRQGERAEMPGEDKGLVTIRMENILTWGEYVRVDRGTDEEDDLERAKTAAEDMDRIAVARDRKASGARLRFDLDLPARARTTWCSTTASCCRNGTGGANRLLPNHCRIHEMLAAEAPPCPLPEHLRRTARRLRDQFQALAPARTWLRGRPDGQDIDLDAYLRFATDRRAGAQADGEPTLSGYAQRRPRPRLPAAGGSIPFHRHMDRRPRSRHRRHPRQPLPVRREPGRHRGPLRHARIQLPAARPGAGAPPQGLRRTVRPGRARTHQRHQARLLHPARGRHPPRRQTSGPGARRPAPAAASSRTANPTTSTSTRAAGASRTPATPCRRPAARALSPSASPSTRKRNDYLPHLFGTGGYVVIRRPAELPSRLPLLYARLTA